MVLALVAALCCFGCAGGSANNSAITAAGLPVSIVFAGTGSGTVTSSPAGFNCSSSCTNDVPSTSSITLVATADPNTIFGGWSGDCTGMSACLVTVDAAKSITATFSRIQLGLATNVKGSGQARLVSVPSGIDCGQGGTGCTAQFDEGSNVTLTPVIAQGSTFAGWNGDCGGIGTCTVSMSATRNVGATFNLIRYAVVVLLNNPGGGLVQSQPQGIVCGQTCFANFELGQTVTLNASPAAGFTFLGWSGDCSGTGICTITGISTAHSVTAHFLSANPS